MRALRLRTGPGGARRHRRTALLLAAATAVATTVLAHPSPAAGGALTRTGWQVLSDGAVFDPGKNSASDGDPSWYNKEAIPAAGDTRWGPAPDAASVNFDAPSPIAAPDCRRRVDYTYFQTVVSVPAGTPVTSATLTVLGASGATRNVDESVRARIFNAKSNKSGAVVSGSYVDAAAGTRAIDLKGVLATGDNRIVLTLMDNCPTRRILRSASFLLEPANHLAPDATQPAVTAVRTQPFSADVARFVSSDATIGAGDLTATVSWGDGSASSAGTVSGPPGGPFTVAGSHTYSAAGTFQVTTNIVMPAKPYNAATATTTATVALLPNESQATCVPGSSCTVSPPPGTGAAFSATGSGGSTNAVLTGQTDGGARPDCSGYTERFDTWLRLGFVDPAAGATWSKTVTLRGTTPLAKGAAQSESGQMEICFSAPYPFPVQPSFALEGGPAGSADFFGLLPECSSANPPPGQGGPTNPCVSSRTIQPAGDGWVPQLQVITPANAQDPGYRG